MRRPGIGYAAVATAAVLWAVGGTVASRLIDEGASFVQLTEARAWITAAALGSFLWLRPTEATRRRAPAALTIVFGLSIAGANFTYYASLSLLPVAVAITVQYTAPALVVAWTVFAEGFRPSRRMLAALVLAVSGVALLAELPVLVGEGKLELSGTGFLYAATSAVAFAVYMVSGERLGRMVGTNRAVFRGFVVASALWAVVQLSNGRPETLLSARFLPWVVFLAVATTIAPFVLFVWGLERVSASTAGVVSTLEPLTAAVIAFAWLGQSLGGWQVAGAAMVLVGIGVVQAERPASEEVLVERAAVE